MAEADSKVSGIIERIQTDGSTGTSYSIASTAYGYCVTGASTQIKNVNMTGFVLNEGVTVHIKFKYANSAASPKLKFNGEANSNAKFIVQYGTTAMDTTSSANWWEAGAVVTLTYDGTNWVRDQGFNLNAMTGATASSNGTVGYINTIPPSNGYNTKFWGADATWKTAITSLTIQTSGPLSGGSNTATTTTGTYTIGFSNQNANTILAGPTSGNAGAPTFRSLIEDDIPNLSANKITSDTLNLARIPTITNAKLENDSITIAGNEVALGGSIGLDDLGLDKTLSFQGITTTNVNTNSTTQTVTINGGSYTANTGDVVLYNVTENSITTYREFVWTGSSWQLLGYAASDAYDSDDISVSQDTVNTPTWISKITQSTNGMINVTRKTMGILPVTHGGTGTETAPTQWGIIYADSTSSYACTSAGGNGHVLIGQGTGNNKAPIWYEGLTLTSTTFNNTTTYLATFSNNVAINGTLEIGNEASYGDDYTPIFWDNGTPAEVTTVQTDDFTITSTGSTTIGDSTCVCANTEVISIIVEETSIPNLNSPISWEITNNQIVLTATVPANKSVTGTIQFIKNT